MGVSPTFQQLDKRKQTRILTAALEEFARHGYAGASINSIVERVGIAKGSIFNYFKDKEGLFLFVFQHALGKVKDHLRGVREDTSGADIFSRIEASLLAGVAFIRLHPRIFQIYLRLHYDQGLKSRAAMIRSVRSHSIHFLSRLLETARERGELRSDLDIPKAAFFLDAVLERFLQAYGVEHLDADLGLFKVGGVEVQRWAAGLVELIRGGIAAEGQPC